MRRRSGILRASLAVVFASLGFSCVELPPLKPDVCGNSVIDIGEDCDGHVPDSVNACAPAGAAHECRYTCVGTDKCPADFDCGGDGVCRRATGTFKKLDGTIPFGSSGSLRTVDFDVDGKPDVLVLGPADALGRRSARFAYPADGLENSSLQPLHIDIAAPVVMDDAGGDHDDAHQDIAFMDPGGVALMHASKSRAPRFGEYPALVSPAQARLRSIPMEVIPSKPGDEEILLWEKVSGQITLERQPGVLQPGVLLPGAVLTTLPYAEDLLAEPIVTQKFDEASPCSTIVLAQQGSTSVAVFSPCRIGPSDVEWNENGEASFVSLPSGAVVDRGVFASDYNLDGHLDLIIGAAGRSYVAYGLGDGTFISSDKPGGVLNVASPLTLPALAGGDTAAALAFADLNADGFVDVVVPTGVVMSAPQGYTIAYANTGLPWTEAVIADFNGNGLLDVAACSNAAINIDFLNNAGDGALNRATIPTDGPASFLRAGDFNGDLLKDLAFSEDHTQQDVVADHLVIAYGEPFGTPSGLVSMATLGEIQGITPARLPSNGAADGLSDLVVSSEDEDIGTDSLFHFEGRSTGVMFAPLKLQNGGGEGALPVALAVGRFFDATTDIAALAVDLDTGRLRLWPIEATEQTAVETTIPSEPLSTKFHAAKDEPLSFRYGAVLAAADLDGDGADEIVAAAPFGTTPDPDSSALVVAEYKKEDKLFVALHEQPFTGHLSVDSTLLLADVDGDGAPDALLTTGHMEKPGDLLIFWGDGQKGFDVEKPPPLPGVVGVRSVALMPAPSGGGLQIVAATEQGVAFIRIPRNRVPDIEFPSKMSQARSVTAADFDGDGLVDLALLADDGLEFYHSIPVLP